MPMPGELPKDAEEAKQGLFSYAKAWGGMSITILVAHYPLRIC